MFKIKYRLLILSLAVITPILVVFLLLKIIHLSNCSLEYNDIKLTPVNRFLLSTVLINRCHITKDELYSHIRKAFPDMPNIKPLAAKRTYVTNKEAAHYIKVYSQIYMKKTTEEIPPENIKFDKWYTDMMQDGSSYTIIADIRKGLTLVTDTEKYIKNLDLTKFEKQGTDFANERYAPERIGKQIDKIDMVYDYDFKRLNKLENKLTYVDRRRVLRYIFSNLTKDANDNNEVYMKIHKFIARSSMHNMYLQPVYPDKTMVTDPLLLLELGEMRCGHVARLAVDLFKAGNYNARLIQAGGHVLAEIYFDDSWHYFDADIFGENSVVFLNGKIPSMSELSEEPYAIDMTASYVESNGRSNYTDTPYPSYNYFSKKAYAPDTALIYEKKATPTEELNNLYGWNYYASLPDKQRILYEMEPSYKPSRIKFKEIIFSDKKPSIVTIQWYPPKDLDNDLSGYRVYVSSQTRGWDYEEFVGEKKLAIYRSYPEGYDYRMYSQMFRKPLSDYALFTITDTSIDISVDKDKNYYISVEPFDEHGEAVGTEYYNMSNELLIRNEVAFR
ncbi:MAG: hypothetical protein WC489_04160 [Patescibacteria group bacterium]